MLDPARFKSVPSNVKSALSVTASPVPLVKNSRLALNDPGVSVRERKSVAPVSINPSELVATFTHSPPTNENKSPSFGLVRFVSVSPARVRFKDDDDTDSALPVMVSPTPVRLEIKSEPTTRLVVVAVPVTIRSEVCAPAVRVRKASIESGTSERRNEVEATPPRV